MQRLKQILLERWQSIALYGVLFLALGLVLGWQLNSLVPGYSQAETTSYQQAMDIGSLLDNPLNAPYVVAVRALTYLHADSYLVTRIASMSVGLITLGFFCWLLRQWYDRRTTIIGTIMFGLSAWFLHATRMGTPEVLMLGITALLACGVWLRRNKSWIALLVCFALIAVLLYVPGMIWFMAIGLFWQWRTVDRAFKNHLLIVSVGALLLLLALAPLGWALYHHNDLITQWLALPSTWPAPLEIIKNIIKVPYHLAASNAADPALWLGTAPVLDVFSVVMFVVGGYLYLRHITLIRTPVFLSVLAAGVVLIALGGTASFSFILPCIYVIVAAGISYLLNQWLSIFPRNPIARGLGVALIVLLVACSCTYHLRHYFVGWPQAKATHDIYTARKP